METEFDQKEGSDKKPLKVLLALFHMAKEKKELWQTAYNEIAKYYSPVSTFINDEPKSNQRDTNTLDEIISVDTVYDTTPYEIKQNFVNRMFRYIFPPETRWLKLVARDDDDGMQKTLDQTAEVLFYFLEKSVFNKVIVQFFGDLFGGHAALSCQCSFDGEFSFQTISPNEIYWLQNNGEYINYIFYRKRVEYSLLKNIFPNKDFPEILEIDLVKEKEHKCEVLTCLFLNEDTKEWECKCYVKDIPSSVKVDWLIKEEKEGYVFVTGYKCGKFSPIQIAIWEKDGRDDYGYGPMLYTKNSIKILNGIAKFSLKSLPTKLMPILFYNKKMVQANALKVEPGWGVPYVPSGDGTNSPPFFQVSTQTGNMQIEEFAINDRRTQIKKLAFDQVLPPTEGQPRTATEIIERRNELLTSLISVYSCLKETFIKPLVMRLLTLLEGNGLLPKEFKVESVISGEIKLELKSAIGESESIESGVKTLQNLSSLLSISPQHVSGLLKMDEIIRDVSIKLGLDAKYLKTQQEVEQDKQQAMAQAQQAAQLQAVAKGQEPQQQQESSQLNPLQQQLAMEAARHGFDFSNN